MPAEIRHLIFMRTEVVQALRRFRVCIGKPLPAGAVISCGAEGGGPGEPVRFKLCIHLDSVPSTQEPPQSGVQEFVFEGATLAAALILDCKERPIPLPATADKTLECFGDHVCLVASFNPRGASL